MLAGMRQESSISHNRTHARIEAVAKDLERVRRDVQLNSETLYHLANAQIQIPSVQARIVLPSIDQTLAAPVAQVSRSPAGPTTAESSSSGVGDEAATEPAVPQYGLDRTVTTVPELWEEWKSGRGLKPPVEELVPNGELNGERRKSVAGSSVVRSS
jgi:hypothetical protein